MCGRFTLTKPVRQVAVLFSVPNPPPELAPRYNVAPAQKVAAVGRTADGTRKLAWLTWGLVPSWANSPSEGPRPINAMGETVAVKPTFRAAFRGHRCLIPADGWYEWTKGAKGQAPHHYHLKDGGVFAFAGLWDVWGTGPGLVASCCIITTAANELVAAQHDRMPVIVPRDQYETWLHPETSVSRLQAMLRPYPAGEMEAVPVSKAVNKVANDGPECLAPAA